MSIYLKIKNCRRIFSKGITTSKDYISRASCLLWLDCKLISSSSEELNKFINQESGLLLCSGNSYGESGNGFLRMNIACPRERLIDGLNRLKKSIDLKLTSAFKIEI